MKKVDLLPAWYLGERRRKKRLRGHVLCMVALGAALSFVHLACTAQVEQLRGEQEALNAKLSRTVDPAAALESAHGTLAHLENVQSAYQELGTPVPMSAVIQQIQNGLTPGMALSTVTVEVEHQAAKGSGFVGDPQNPPKYHDVAQLTVVGVSPNDKEVAQLIDQLSTNPLFNTVTMNYTRSENIREYAVRRFEIHMQMDMEVLGTEDGPGAPQSVALNGSAGGSR